MADKTFNFIRFLAEIGITAIGTFYKVVAEIWDLPHGEAVLATCVALSTLIGVWTEYMRYSYNKAQHLVEPPDIEAPADSTELNYEVKREEIE